MNKPAFLKLSISMVIFGSIGFFSKYTGLPALELVFVRCVSASAILAVYWFATGQYKKERWNIKEMLFILGGGVTLVINWLFLFLAFEKTSVTVAISIYNTAPLIVLVAGWMLFREKFQWGGLLATLAAFIGTIMITVTASSAFSHVLLVGSVYAFCAAIFYAGTVMIGTRIKQASPYLVTFLQTFIGVIMLAPFVDFSKYTGLTPENWTFSLLTGVIHTGIVYLLFYGSIRFLCTSVISALSYLDPCVAILLDIFITGFAPSYMQAAGIAIIFLAVSYTVRKNSQEDPAAQRQV
ncbi:DMT family transporter [Heyndrickxia faecalis]|uniref:DMT family transporter n=1 Tax=Heyndrickxia faecalis TaxID=2824910 RepID=UPI003D21F847